MNRPVWVNSAPVAQVDVTDRGLAYGDGVFETLLCREGQLPLVQRHWERLERGCEVIDLPMPHRDVLLSDMQQAIDAYSSSHSQFVVKVTLTRGSGGLGYTPPETPATTRIVQCLAFPNDLHPDGLKCAVLTSRLGSNRRLAGIKHLNRLEQVLAAQEVSRREVHDGLVCNQQGFLVEATSSNVILVFAQQVVTPKLDTAGVQGVMRDVLMEATEGTDIEIVKDYVHESAVEQADEIILCNSVRGVRRVQQIGDTQLTQVRVFERLKQYAETALSN